MRTYLALLLAVFASTAFGANPSFQSFNVNQFDVSGNQVTIESGALTTNLVVQTARHGVESLGAANVINVTNFGAIPYIPNSFTTGAWPTNAVDNSAAISNAFRFASNSPAPRVVYFPPGFYKITNGLVIPPLTSIMGEGWLHQGGNGAPRILQNSSQVATNNFSVIWWAGDRTNGNVAAIRAPYTGYGPMGIYNIEVCGATNPMVDLGVGYSDSLSIEMTPSAQLGACGINFDAGSFCGGFVMDGVSVPGFRIGVNHAGNNVKYSRCQFTGSDIGLLCTNNFAPDQVIVENSSIGNRVGGIGYYLRNAKGWTFIGDSCVNYRTYMVMVTSDVEIHGGVQEGGNGTLPSWTLAGSGSTFYETNTWQFRNGAIEAYAWSGVNGSGSLFMSGCQFRDNGVMRDCLVNDIASLWSGSLNLFARNVYFSTTNQQSGSSILLRTVPNDSPFDGWDYDGINNPMVELVSDTRPGTPTLLAVYPAKKNSLFPRPAYHVYVGRNLGFYTLATNLTLAEYGEIKLLQGVTAGKPDRLVIQMAQAVTNGIPTLRGYNILTSDPAPTGLADTTNFTVEGLKWKTGTNLNTSYIPTNTAPFSILTNEFVLNTFYTNADQRAYVQASVGLLSGVGGNAQVALYIDQEQNGSFERTGITEALVGIAASATNSLGGFIQPRGRFVFTNLSGGGGVANIQANSSEWVKQ